MTVGLVTSGDTRGRHECAFHATALASDPVLEELGERAVGSVAGLGPEEELIPTARGQFHSIF